MNRVCGAIYKFYWEHTGQGGVRLLRAFGTTAEAILPDEIEGLPLTEIGAYCFAASSRLPEHYEMVFLRVREESEGACAAPNGRIWERLYIEGCDANREMKHTIGYSEGSESRHVQESCTGCLEQHTIDWGESPRIKYVEENAVSHEMKHTIDCGEEMVCCGESYHRSGGMGDIWSLERELCELSGKYLKKLALPDTVEKVGNLAFYNCSALECLEIGKDLEQIGSDVFMNCRSLRHMILRSAVREKSGIRQILSQISSELEVVFLRERETEAVLLFPEYYEGYDEISPAHVFGRKIEGEGFRARQCFKEGIADFTQYDLIFPKASVEESAEVLCRLAMNRLRYPIDLEEQRRELYKDYICAHAGEIFQNAILKRDKEQMHFLCEQKLVQCSVLEDAIGKASRLEWAEGAVYLLHLKEVFFPGDEKEGRYTFDEF